MLFGIVVYSIRTLQFPLSRKKLEKLMENTRNDFTNIMNVEMIQILDNQDNERLNEVSLMLLSSASSVQKQNPVRERFAAL